MFEVPANSLVSK